MLAMFDPFLLSLGVRKTRKKGSLQITFPLFSVPSAAQTVGRRKCVCGGVVQESAVVGRFSRQTLDSLGTPEKLYHRDDALLYIAYVMLIWAAPIPADRWHCSLWP